MDAEHRELQFIETLDEVERLCAPPELSRAEYAHACRIYGSMNGNAAAIAVNILQMRQRAYDEKLKQIVREEMARLADCKSRPEPTPHLARVKQRASSLITAGDVWTLILDMLGCFDAAAADQLIESLKRWKAARPDEQALGVVINDQPPKEPSDVDHVLSLLANERDPFRIIWDRCNQLHPSLGPSDRKRHTP